jgi:rhodanese-related sulfurtransferase
MVFALVLSAGPRAFAAPPSLFYSLLPLNHSQETCMKRAHATVASEIKGGRIDKRADNISLVNDDFNIGVHCRKTGSNKSFATIVVAHRASFNEAKGVALNIRGGMETGINE